MPYYVDSERKYAIWFNGQRDWLMGYVSDVEEGNINSGFVQNDELVECPTDTTSWREYSDGEWKTNVNATLTEYSKWYGVPGRTQLLIQIFLKWAITINMFFGGI